MSTTPAQVERVYLLLTLLTTLAASFIFGVNTLFLLDAGLSNTEAFAANAFFSIGMVLFEVPTGVVADTRGRRFSFMLGAATLLVSTLLYLGMWAIGAPFIGWAVVSILLGLGLLQLLVTNRVVVTGASSGIGREIAVQLATAGATVCPA